MATRITLAPMHLQFEEGAPARYVVQESFEEVCNRVVPITPASSSLEYRQTTNFTLENGKSIMLNPGHIEVVEADYEEDE